MHALGMFQSKVKNKVLTKATPYSPMREDEGAGRTIFDFIDHRNDGGHHVFLKLYGECIPANWDYERNGDDNSWKNEDSIPSQPITIDPPLLPSLD